MWQVNYERSQPSEYEHAVVQQCLRFLSSETDYTPRAQHLLLRCLQANEPKERQAFFSEVRACRRRRQDAWEGYEVAAILREPSEFALFELRALLAATHRRLRARGLAPRQAFHAFNSSRTGLMSCSELYSSLRWLQLQPSVDLVHEAMRRLDTDDDGCLTVDDFVCALQRDQPAADAEADAAAAAAAPSAQHLVIPFSRIRELYAEEDEVLRGPAVTLSAAELAQFVAMLRALTSFDRHVGAGGLSAWSPSLGGAGRAAVLVPLGHYVRESAGGVPLACQTLEVRDMKQEGGGGLFARDASRRLQARPGPPLPSPGPSGPTTPRPLPWPPPIPRTAPRAHTQTHTHAALLPRATPRIAGVPRSELPAARALPDRAHRARQGRLLARAVEAAAADARLRRARHGGDRAPRRRQGAQAAALRRRALRAQGVGAQGGGSRGRVAGQRRHRLAHAAQPRRRGQGPAAAAHVRAPARHVQFRLAQPALTLQAALL